MTTERTIAAVTLTFPADEVEALMLDTVPNLDASISANAEVELDNGRIVTGFLVWSTPDGECQVRFISPQRLSNGDRFSIPVTVSPETERDLAGGAVRGGLANWILRTYRRQLNDMRDRT